ncbi:hypothetical protein Tco_0051940 [Tanacetum coccineum]
MSCYLDVLDQRNNERKPKKLVRVFWNLAFDMEDDGVKFCGLYVCQKPGTKEQEQWWKKKSYEPDIVVFSVTFSSEFAKEQTYTPIAMDIESEPFEDPIETEETLPLSPRAAPLSPDYTPSSPDYTFGTLHTNEESDTMEASKTMTASPSNSTSPLSPDHPLTQTSPTPTSS